MREADLPGILFALLIVLPYVGAVATALTPLVAAPIGRWRSEMEQVAPAAAVVAAVACVAEVVVSAALLLRAPGGAEVGVGPLALRAAAPALRTICICAVAALLGLLWAAFRMGGRMRTAISIGLLLWLGWAALAAAGAPLWAARARTPAAVGLVLAAALLAAALIRSSSAPPGRRRTLEAIGLAVAFALAALAVGASVLAPTP